MKILPTARNNDVVIQEANNEMLVYDLLTNKAYCLNETSAKVFHACGNNESFEDLKREHNFADDLIYLSLDELKKSNLLAGEYNSPFANMNRREVIRKVGLGCAVALPVISSLIAPQSLSAQSANAAPGTVFSGTYPNNGTVTSSTECTNAIVARCRSRRPGNGSFCTCSLNNPCNYSIVCA